MSLPRVYTVSIDGNIGVGKTTILSLLESYQNVFVCHEPVNKWTNVGGIDLLALNRRNPDLWAMPFNSYVQTTLAASHHKQPRVAFSRDGVEVPMIKIMERTMASAKNVFLEAARANSILTEEQHTILRENMDELEEIVDTTVDITFFLHASSKTCLKRIQTRARPGDALITHNNLVQLDALYQSWMEYVDGECVLVNENVCPTTVVKKIIDVLDKEGIVLIKKDDVEIYTL